MGSGDTPPEDIAKKVTAATDGSSSDRTNASGVNVTDNDLDRVVEIWKTTVAVQQHFNDLEMRIRNYAVTLLTAVLGVVAFALKEKLSVDIGGFHTSLASCLLIAGLVGWLGFYLMDRFWYHKLLQGAVEHGSSLEKKYEWILPELGLTNSIGRASPIKPFLLPPVHSGLKMTVFYGLVTILLMFLAVMFHLTAPP